MARRAKKCPYGRKKNGACKRKPGPKRCKRRPGPKRRR